MKLYGRDSARKSLIDTVTLRVLSQVLTVLGFVVLVRGMSEADFGVYSLLYAFIPVIGMAASFGLAQVLRRYQPEYLQAGNSAAAAWLVKVIATARFVTNVAVLAIILLLWDYIAPVFDLASHRPTFAVFSFLIILRLQTAVLRLAIAAHMLHRYSIGSAALLAAIKLVLYSALFQADALALETAILTDIVANAAAYVFMHVAYRRKCLDPEAGHRYRPDPVERRRLLRYGMLNNFNDAGVLLMYSTLDNFVIAGFLGTAGVGIYAFYGRIRRMIVSLQPSQLFNNIIHPMFFSIPAAEAQSKLPRYFSFLLNMNLMLIWPVFAFSMAYHGELVEAVFGGKFIEHSWLLPLILGFALLNTISEPATLVAQYEEKAGIILISKLFIIYNVAVMFALVPLLGVFGAALSAGSAQTFKNVFIWWHVRRNAVWTNARTALPVAIVLWGAAMSVCLAIKALVPMPATAHLVIGVAVVGAAALLHVRSSAVSAFDRDLLQSLTPDRVSPVLRYLGVFGPKNARSAT